MITIQLLGGACLRSGDAPVAGPPAQRHRIALLTLIVASWPQPLSRDRAMALLWPERDLAGSRRLLNLAVHVLRSALGETAIASTGDGLLLNPTAVRCDLHDLRAAIAADACERVVQLYAGSLLDGFHLGDSIEFTYWLEERRNELAHAYIAALFAVAKRQEESGDVHGRVRTCLRLVSADPHSAKHAQALMRALDAAGDRAGAIQHATEHAQRLRAELGLEADDAVVALAQRLRDAGARQQPRPGPPGGSGSSPDDQARVRMEPTRDIHAYQLFLQARQGFIEYSMEAIPRSIELFDRAIARDPSFALAWAHLAMAYTELAEDGAMAPDVAYGRATEAARRALRLDPQLGAAHCTMGHLKAVREFDWSGAEEEFKRALSLGPSHAHTYALYGRFCAALARYDEAIALHTRARELDPLVHRMDLVTALLRAGRYPEAVAEAESAKALDPGAHRTRATLGWAYLLSGWRDEGLAQLEQAVELSQHPAWLAQLGEACGLAGNKEKARAILGELENRARTSFISPYYFAYVYTGLGDPDRAMDWLERAVTSRSGPVYGIKGSFLLAPLHKHPRFRALLRQMKLE